MTTLIINNKKVKVSDDFLNLSPEDQNRTVEEIAASMGAASPVTGRDGMTTADRIAAAKAGTLAQPSPERLAATGAADEAALAGMQPAPGIGGMIYENLIGSGAVDTPGERAGELVRGLGAAIPRGAAGLLGLPGDIGLLIDEGTKKLGLIPKETPASPLFSAMSGETMRKGLSAATGGQSDYVAPGFLGKVASTGGEMIGSGAGKALGMMAGLTSEGAGEIAKQAGIGETGQEVAKFAGTFFAPVAISTGNKTVNALMKKASEAPSLETLKSAKNAAYKAVDDAGVTFGAPETKSLADNINNLPSLANYVPDVDLQTRAALEIVNKYAGKTLTLGQLDNIRKSLWARVSAAPKEVAIRDMIDEVDTLIAAMPATDPIMGAARLANSRFKKAELIENAFQKAADQTAATGSGGNIVNKYRQAVTSIINNPKQAKFFTKEEVAMMRNFVSGSNAQNALRLIGKVSPSGNGLMMALNIGAVAANPLMAGVTVAGAGAKALSESSAMANAKRIRDALATGVIPQQSTGGGANMARIIPGLLAQ